MAYESKVGICMKVTIGDDKILGMGTWSISGGAYAQLDDTEFCDYDEQILRGLRTAADVTFAGNYKKDDVSGQDLIRDAYWLKSDLTDLRFYVDDTSYYTPNSTTAEGGGLPANSVVSHIKIMAEPTITVDKGDLAKIEFSGKIVGAMRLI
jgi:hypothetical protein